MCNAWDTATRLRGLIPQAEDNSRTSEDLFTKGYHKGLATAYREAAELLCPCEMNEVITKTPLVRAIWSEAEVGRAAYCQHNVDSQVHCCLCHSGFVFDGMVIVDYMNVTADPILAIREIKEGEELREKAGSGKLVELDENQSWPSDPFYPIDTFRIRKYNQLCENSGFRRVKG